MRLRFRRDAVRAGLHRCSQHALDELHADNLHPVDAESALLTGAVTRTENDSPALPGPRYSVVGTAADLMTKVAEHVAMHPEEATRHESIPVAAA